MKPEIKKALSRACIGFPCGAGVVCLLPILWGCVSGGGVCLTTGALVLSKGTEAGAALFQFLCVGTLGAAIGFSSIFLEREGSFLWNSLWHFLFNITAFTATAWNCRWFEVRGDRFFPRYLGVTAVLAAFYLIVWAARCIAWRSDVAAIRKKMGLAEAQSGPSPLKWRESLPYLVLAAALFLLLRPLLAPLDGPDVPVLTGLLLPWLCYPFTAAVAGFAAGRRYGPCPLLPPAVLTAFLPNLLFFSPAYDLSQGLAYAGIALVFNLLGALWGKLRQKQK